MKELEREAHKSVLLFLLLSPLSSVFNTLSSGSFLLLAVLLSSPSQALPYSEDCDGEENYTARERRQTREHRNTEEEEEIRRRRRRRIRRRREDRRD